MAGSLNLKDHQGRPGKTPGPRRIPKEPEFLASEPEPYASPDAPEPQPEPTEVLDQDLKVIAFTVQVRSQWVCTIFDSWRRSAPKSRILYLLR